MLLAAVATAVLAQGAPAQVAQTEIAVLGVKGAGVKFDELEDALQGRVGPLNRCYQDRLFSEPGTTGTMRLAFAIDPHGRASEIVAEAPALKYLDACVVPLVRGWAFPFKGRQAVKVEAQITFSIAPPKKPQLIDRLGRMPDVTSGPIAVPQPGQVPDMFRGMQPEIFIRGKLDFSIEKVSTGEIDMSVLERYIRARKAALLGCYEKQLRLQPALHGSIPVHFSITTTGRASGITTDNETMQPVSTCIALMIRGWVFPFKPAADARVSLILKFEVP